MMFELAEPWAGGGPGPWFLFVPVLWALVIVGVVTLLRRTGRRHGGPGGRFRGPQYSARADAPRPSPYWAGALPPGRSTRRSTGAGSPSWRSTSAPAPREARHDRRLPHRGRAHCEGRRALKAYGADEARVRTPEGVNLDLPAGQFAAVMGPSGSA